MESLKAFISIIEAIRSFMMVLLKMLGDQFSSTNQLNLKVLYFRGFVHHSLL